MLCGGHLEGPFLGFKAPTAVTDCECCTLKDISPTQPVSKYLYALSSSLVYGLGYSISGTSAGLSSLAWDQVCKDHLVVYLSCPLFHCSAILISNFLYRSTSSHGMPQATALPPAHFCHPKWPRRLRMRIKWVCLHNLLLLYNCVLPWRW